MTLIEAFQLLSGPVLYRLFNCFVPRSLYEKILFKQTQRLRYVQIINVWSRSQALFSPGHELYKQIVKIAFHVKKSDTSVELEQF